MQENFTDKAPISDIIVIYIHRLLIKIYIISGLLYMFYINRQNLPMFLSISLKSVSLLIWDSLERKKSRCFWNFIKISVHDVLYFENYHIKKCAYNQFHWYIRWKFCQPRNWISLSTICRILPYLFNFKCVRYLDTLHFCSQLNFNLKNFFEI